MSNDAIDIILKNGTPAEMRMRSMLTNLFARYDLTGWTFTRKIEVDETAMPHSHPVLTLNADSARDEMMALSELVHEQLHWFEEEHAESRNRAIMATTLYYPSVPTSRPEGAGDETSTRLHLLVCYLEYQALKVLVSEEVARELISALSRHHYCWVYRTVLADERRLAEIIREYGLLPEPLRAVDRPNPSLSGWLRRG
jgi:hypothetical protein